MGQLKYCKKDRNMTLRAFREWVYAFGLGAFAQIEEELLTNEDLSDRLLTEIERTYFVQLWF